jgi:hypothetical protein
MKPAASISGARRWSAAPPVQDRPLSVGVGLSIGLAASLGLWAAIGGLWCLVR